MSKLIPILDNEKVQHRKGPGIEFRVKQLHR